MSAYASYSDFQARTQRIFKTRWFTREARRFGINDVELVEAIQQLLNGRADDLGGGVWKKRLSRNADRAIVLAKNGSHFFFVFLYAKSAMANIRRDELLAFRELAQTYSGYDMEMLNKLVADGVLMELKND